MSDTEPQPNTQPAAATREDLLAAIRLLLGTTALAMLLVAVTFGIGAAILVSTRESRGGVGLCVVLMIASAVSALVAVTARNDPNLRP